MTGLVDLTAGPHAFSQAVVRQVSKPMYVKIRLFFGCNLKYEMCIYRRFTPEPLLTIPRFQEILDL